MPWRVGPEARKRGRRPDPYRVWLSEIMLQQTTVAAVTGYFERFTQRWPDVVALADAKDADVMGAWAGLGYYARARNLLRCARIVTEEFDGVFPDTRDGLRALPGIGPYTSAAIAAIAFDRPEAVLDGNVERVLARVHLVETPLPRAKGELGNLAARHTPVTRPGDYAQAIMDLGATVCTPRSPDCASCPLSDCCKARKLGVAPEFPRKAPRAVKQVRRGFVYVGRSEDGSWLLETRETSGMLGGMLGWPSSDWTEDPDPAPPAAGEWVDTGEVVLHTFTHFHLRLSVLTARLPDGTTPDRGRFMSADTFQPSELPTLMRKVFSVAAPKLDRD